MSIELDTTTSVQTTELAIKQFWATLMLDESRFASVKDSRLFLRHSLENLAYILTASMKVPAKVLQDDREVARWPVRRWDNFLVSIGLRRYAKFKTLNFTEMLLFPNVPVPLRAETLRIYTQESIKGV